MRIGIKPSIADAEYSYSAGCRAYSLIRNIPGCELYTPGESYDLVYLQKCFDLELIRSCKRAGIPTLLDVCDFKSPYPVKWLRAMREVDFMVTPTLCLQSVLRFQGYRHVYLAPDAHEYSWDWPLVDVKPGSRKLVVPGTFFNVSTLKAMRGRLGGTEEILVLTDPAENYQRRAVQELRGVFPDIVVKRWEWSTISGLLSDCAVMLVLYADGNGIYKSCNRACLGQHMGMPVVSFRHPELTLLDADGAEGIFQYEHPDSLPVSLDHAFEYSDWLCAHPDHRRQMRIFVQDSPYGLREALRQWSGVFKSICGGAPHEDFCE